MKKALITGVAGQDGSYFAEKLLSEGYEVFGFDRPGADRKFVPSTVTIIEGDLEDADSIRNAVKIAKPDEVCNFAGVTTLKEAYEDPEKTRQINNEAVRVLLEAAVESNPSIRFLQASSSEVFLPSDRPLNEESPRDWETKNPYALAKMSADRDVIQAARQRGVFACSAFLFNHESPRRREDAALRKITKTLVKISLGMESKLLVGNVDQRRDWGFAGDYVEAMRRMLRQDVPEDFVIASGELHTVKEAIEIAAETLGIADVWNKIEVSQELSRPNETYPKVGDISKANKKLDWKPKIDFATLIRRMVEAELDALKQASMSRMVHENMELRPQVPATHYFNRRYLYKERWTNYWYQIEAMLTLDSKRVLEIGVGNGIVCDALTKCGMTVETADIDPELKPTYTASVTSLPVPDASYDVVLCAEVLEHLPYEDSLRAMKELYRVTRRHALVTLPHAGYTFSFLSKLPLLPWLSFGFKIPHFWKTHTFNGQHYWELGKKGFSKRRLASVLRDAGFSRVTTTTHPDDPAHVFYLCEK